MKKYTVPALLVVNVDGETVLSASGPAAINNVYTESAALGRGGRGGYVDDEDDWDIDE